jgi:hypothetical protein
MTTRSKWPTRSGAARPAPRRSAPSSSGRSRRRPPLGVLLGDEVHRRGVGQVRLKAFTAWFTSATRSARNSTRFAPVAAHQQVGQRDHRARLAGAGRHHEQRLAVVVALEGLGDAADGPRLVVRSTISSLIVAGERTPRRRAAGSGAPARPSCRTPAPGAADSGCRPRASARSRWSRRSPAAGRTAAPGSRRRASPAAGRRVGHRGACAWPRPARAACRRRPRARSRRSPALLIGHPADLELPVARLVERPARLLEQQVDEVVPGLGLGVVVGVGLRGPHARDAAARPHRRRGLAPADPCAHRCARTSRRRGTARAPPRAHPPQARAGGCARRGCRAC